jgi:DNA repair protein RecO (recombination protein O)
MKRIDTEAFALRSYNLDEASRIVVCLTPEHGIIRGVATGARRMKSQFGASFEPFTLIRLSYYEKEGRELMSIRSSDIQKSFFALAGDERISTALGRFGRLLMEFAAPAEPNDSLFRMVKACLFAVEKNGERVPLAVLYFEIWLLKLMGFMPDWTECGECGDSLAPGPAWLETEHKVFCVKCKTGRGLLVSKGVLSLLRSSRRSAPEVFVSAEHQGGATSITDAFEVTGYLINSVLAPKTLPRIDLSPRDLDGSRRSGQESPVVVNQ